METYENLWGPMDQLDAPGRNRINRKHLWPYGPGQWMRWRWVAPQSAGRALPPICPSLPGHQLLDAKMAINGEFFWPIDSPHPQSLLVNISFGVIPLSL